MRISTSILGAKDRVECVTKLNRTNTSYIHIDVMDGEFVSNTQFNKINEVNAINMVSKYPLDIHLMVSNPYEYVIQYKNMNVEFITFHVEVDGDKNRVIDEIHNMGYKMGLSIKPNTDINELRPYLDKIDMILVMSVEPGLGGQEFISGTVDRIKEVRELIGDRGILIEVDGGINDSNINKLQDVDIAVVGSYITGSDDYYGRIDSLLKKKNIVRKKENVEKNYLARYLLLFYLMFALFRAMYRFDVGFEPLCLDGGCGSNMDGWFGFQATFLFWMFFLVPILIIYNVIKAIISIKK